MRAGVDAVTGMRNASEVIRFGVFEVDLRTGELRRHGLRVRLPSQSFQVLQLLLEHPGGMVSREELREKLWPANTFVDFDHGVNAAVKRLREALGDSADNPRFVETLPRRGYRFIAPVEGNPDSGEDVRELEKDRPQRLGDMADARLEVEEALTATRSASPTAASVVTPARPASWRRALPWAITAILGVGWILVLGRWGPWKGPHHHPMLHSG